MILEPDWFKIDIGLTSDLHGIGAGLAPDTADGPWIDANWHWIDTGLALDLRRIVTRLESVDN